ncbi:MAG: arylsulfatase [Gemmataceae bacterium]
MFKSVRFQAIALVAVGALLGYAASRADVIFPASASSDKSEVKSDCSNSQDKSCAKGCCSKGASRSQAFTCSTKEAAPSKNMTACSPSRVALADSKSRQTEVAILDKNKGRESTKELANVIAKAVQRQNGTRPNILVIFGDDIGYWNLSYNNRGMMGYKTPNIDRIAKEGMMFTDYYAQQSCTAGRAAFITGQIPVRTGLTKVGMPGARVGLQAEDPTLAVLLKLLGYLCGQFGKNHLGDRNEFLPTVHGFDEFYGNLYHLNAEEEPENEDYPGDLKLPNGKTFREVFGPRGVLKCEASKKDDPTVDPRFGRVGKQTIKDTGPLTKKRMESVDREFLNATKDFIKNAVKNKKPFFAWFNATRMHFYTHVKKANRKKGRGFYADGMVEHDRHVGELLQLLDDLNISDNTIVIYTTDNGPHYNEWPDGGITIFRGEKNTNWEGGFRVPCVIRWPGKIPAGSVSNEIFSHEDWLPTLVAAAGDPDVKSKLKKGLKAGGRNYKVYIDGYNQLQYLTGKEKKSPRKSFFYFSDDGEFMNIRYQDWVVVYMEQRAKRFDVWREPFVKLRSPKIFNLRRDPFQKADTDSNNYNRWWAERAFMIAPATAIATKYLQTFKEFPPRQRPEAWNLDEVMERIEKQQQIGGR